MGGLLNLFEFNQGSMARKFLTHKRHVGGLEAPRNSLELPVETSQSYCAVGDDVSISYQMNQDWSEKSYPTKASMKRLINEEISKRPNTRHNAPSIVARLMGMDVLPLDTKLAVQPIEKKNEHMGITTSKKERTEKSSVGHVPSKSNSCREELNSFHHNKDRDPDLWSSSLNLGKPKRREHPQEEELQKFKKEFEAWQAARLRECSRVVELESIPRQLLAQENLNKDKMALYANSGRTGSEKPVELKGHTVKSRPHERGDLQHHGYKLELFPTGQKESISLRSNTIGRDFKESPLMSFGSEIG
ncbi:hypothetical protein L1049_024684 [Liquidambar formosana]|uniref:DUF3741 domain-containing protein n=1 Tax=Liquidambar formosana TaxID=63359 RepID=A0AAP0X5B5_LIQFO